MLRTDKLNGLKDAAIPKRRFLRGLHDNYHSYIHKEGSNVAEFNWNGYLIANLLCYLQERREIDMMHSEFDELASFLGEERKISAFFITTTHKSLYFDMLQPDSFSTSDLTEYYNNFNDASETNIGNGLLDGIKAIRASMLQLDEASVVLLTIS